MNVEPPAVIEIAPVVETDAEFRAWVRDEFRFVRDELKHLRECAKDTGKAVDELLRLAKLEEQRHEAEHG